MARPWIYRKTDGALQETALFDEACPRALRSLARSDEEKKRAGVDISERRIPLERVKLAHSEAMGPPTSMEILCKDAWRGT